MGVSWARSLRKERHHDLARGWVVHTGGAGLAGVRGAAGRDDGCGSQSPSGPRVAGAGASQPAAKPLAPGRGRTRCRPACQPSTYSGDDDDPPLASRLVPSWISQRLNPPNQPARVAGARGASTPAEAWVARLQCCALAAPRSGRESGGMVQDGGGPEAACRRQIRRACFVLLLGCWRRGWSRDSRNATWGRLGPASWTAGPRAHRPDCWT